MAQQAEPNSPPAAQHQAGAFWIRAVDDVLIIAITDRAGRILHANDRFCRISGYSAQELIGANHRILNSGVHDRAFFTEMFRTISRGETWRGEICNRAKDGSLYWVATTIIPERDAEGQVSRYVSCRFDITEQKLAEQRMHEMAVTDPLTGLQNRHGFRLGIASMLAEAEAGSSQLALLVIDMDDFKDINDIHGHEAGDEFLRIIAARLARVLRPDDLVARLGGDELAIVLRLEDGAPPPIPVIERLQAAIREPVEIGPASFLATASIGLALFPQDGRSSAELLNSADLALYAAKNAGRNRFARFDPAMLEKARRRVQLQEQAHAGLERGEFELHYQPIVALGAGGLPSAEALLRWRHPTHGLLGFEQFAEIFESHRLTVAIGTFVQHGAVAQAGEWIRAGLPFHRVKFNTTEADFGSGGYAARLLALLGRHGVPPERIGVEIVESMFLGQQSPVIRQELAALAAAGVEIAFDDFGTGFASPRHLTELPVTHIKIDRSFVARILADRRDRHIVQAIVALAHDLGLSVTAEGVEQAEQAELLVAMGADCLQGHWFAGATPAAEAPAAFQALAASTADLPAAA